MGILLVLIVLLLLLIYLRLSANRWRSAWLSRSAPACHHPQLSVAADAAREPLP